MAKTTFNDLEKRFRKFNRILSHKLSLQNREDGEYYRGVARRKAPMKTGLLRQGIVVARITDSDNNKCWGLISKRPAGAKSPYNIFQEMGFVHNISGKQVKAQEFMIDTYLLMAKKIPKNSEDTVREAVYAAFN